MATLPAETRPPWHEADRLAALRRLAILDTAPERSFDDIVELVRTICDAPVALVSLVDANRQWFKAKAGTDIPETDLDSSICALAIRETGLFVIPDLSADPRTAAMPIVADGPKARFYAGAPLIGSSGLPLGTLCAIDMTARPDGLSSRQRLALEALGREVVSQIELRARMSGQIEAAQRDDARLLETMVRAQQLVVAKGGATAEVMQALIDGALTAIPAADGVVVEIREGEDMVYSQAVGSAAGAIGLRLPVSASLSGRSLTEGRTFLIADATTDPSANREAAERLGMRSMIVVPLFRRGAPLGVLKVHAAKEDAFGSRELLIAQLLSGLIATGFAENDEAFMLALSDRLRDEDGDRGLDAASALIGEHFGCARVGYGALLADQDQFEWQGCWTDGSVPPLLGRWPSAMFGPCIVAKLAQGETLAIADLRDDPLGADAAVDGLKEGADIRAILVVPLAQRGPVQRVVYLNATRPRRWTEADIALMEEIGERTVQIFERKRAEEALRTSEAHWRGLFHLIDDSFFIAEAMRGPAGEVIDWRYLQVNHAFVAQTGMPEERIVGHTASSVNPRLGAYTLAQVGAMLASGETAAFDRRRDDRWFRGRAFKLEGERFGVLFSDATEDHRERQRREALIALAGQIDNADDPEEIAFAASALLARTLAVNRVGYGVIDRASETIRIERDWNAPGVASIAGTLRFRDYGSYIEDLKRGETVAIDDVRLDPRTADLAGALEAIGARSFVNMPVTEQGDAVALFFVNHGAPRDWSPDLDLIREFAIRTRAAVERRRAERELAALTASLEAQVEQRTAALIEAEEQLRQSQKMEAVGQLTGGLAHDFNNMLTGIAGGLEMIQVRVAQGRTGELERYVTAAQGAARRAAALTHRLLAFSRRQTLDPRPTDVNRLIRGMEELVRRTVGPRIEVEVVQAAGLWATLVDPNQLENALLNLAINARDAMPDGGRITIETANKWLDPRAAAERNLGEGQFLSLCVTDTGIGMSADIAARAFDPFFTTKPLGEGTGLGLSMIYGFARQSDGQVRIYSELGEGTTVCLYLPRFVGEADGDDLPIEATQRPASPSGKTVLVVDDEPTIRMLVAEVLQEMGYAVIEAGDGEIALKVLESDAVIDLLITDVGLPGALNGRQVADGARTLRPKLKVLFITGYAENAVIGNGRLDPGMELVTKPFAMDALRAKIGAMLAG